MTRHLELSKITTNNRLRVPIGRTKASDPHKSSSKQRQSQSNSFKLSKNLELNTNNQDHVTKQGVKYYHVISGDEGIVDSDEFNIVSLQNNSSHQSANSSKTCNSPKVRFENPKKNYDQI